MAAIDLYAVQPFMTLQDYRNATSFYHKMAYIMRTIPYHSENSSPSLVVFPEDLATFLVLADRGGVIRGAATMDEAFTRIGRSLALPLALTMARYGTTSLKRAFFLLNAPKVWEIWYRTMSRLAREHHVYIVAGSALLPADSGEFREAIMHPFGKQIYNTSITLNPAGRVIHYTRKVNLVPTQEDVLDLTAGPLEMALKGFQAGSIACATAICYDGFRVPHTTAEPSFTPLLPLMDSRGAKIIAQPSANPWPWDDPFPLNPTRIRRDQWREEGAFSLMESCSNIQAIVNPQLLMSSLDIHFDGPSVIYGRIGGRATVLASSRHSTAALASEEVVHANIDV